MEAHWDGVFDSGKYETYGTGAFSGTRPVDLERVRGSQSNFCVPGAIPSVLFSLSPSAKAEKTQPTSQAALNVE